MLVTWETNETPIYILLDKGCSNPLISSNFVDKWNVLCLEHKNPIPI
jgi:hypothetical protein